MNIISVPGINGPISDLSKSSFGELTLISASKKSVLLTSNKEIISEFESESRVVCNIITENGIGAIGQSNGNVVLYQLEGQNFAEVQKFKLDAAPVSLEFAPKEHGVQLAVAGSDGKVSLYKFETEREVPSWSSDQQMVCSVGITDLSFGCTKDEVTLVVGCVDGLSRVITYGDKWNVKAELDNEEFSTITCVEWNRTEGTGCFASGNEDGRVEVWTNKTGTWENEVINSYSQTIQSLSWDCSGKSLSVAYAAATKADVWCFDEEEGKWKLL